MNSETTIEDILTRLNKLEAVVFVTGGRPAGTKSVGTKARTLPELIKGKTIKNGQEKVAVIVGYIEHELSSHAVTPDDIRSAWRQAKFNGGYAPILLARAVATGLVSNYGTKGNYVLTQSGEEFYQGISQ